jgi:hypothetical protein
MSGSALQLEHSINAEVSPEFAWNYRTDIANWNDPPARFTLVGPFIAGSRGTTLWTTTFALEHPRSSAGQVIRP